MLSATPNTYSQYKKVAVFKSVLVFNRIKNWFGKRYGMYNEANKKMHSYSKNHGISM